SVVLPSCRWSDRLARQATRLHRGAWLTMGAHEPQHDEKAHRAVGEVHADGEEASRATLSAVSDQSVDQVSCCSTRSCPCGVFVMLSWTELLRLPPIEKISRPATVV